MENQPLKKKPMTQGEIIRLQASTGLDLDFSPEDVGEAPEREEKYN